MKDYKALQDKIEKAYEYAFDFAMENSIPITTDYLAKNVHDHLSTFNLVISPKDIAKKIVKVHDYGFANHIALTPEYIAGELAKDLLDEWSMTCDRCKGKCKSLKMSWLNTQMLCESCQKKEESHPLYKEAKKRELEEVKKGNYNYPGILG